MASSSVLDEMSRIKATMHRAANNPDRGGPMRRNAFKELIELTHSPDSSLKSYAADHIRVFFTDFPDLEEDAINGVYDLCEDLDPKVRIDGYRAVTEVSQAQPRWVKRNADVLVQLLQSDEPEEVAVVKSALLKHLDLDPPVTLGVLCDQIVPPEEEMDEYERQTREGLRSLVISFLATDASGAIEKYTDPPGSEAEQILVDQLTLSISRLDTRDIDVIVKDILLSLSCYRKNYSRGNDLLQILLDKATPSLQGRTNSSQLLKTALLYLSLAQTVAVDERAASPSKLLRFYLSSLTGKMVLQKFLENDRVLVISWIADAISASEVETGVDTQQLSQVRRQVVDASPILLEVLFDAKPLTRHVWHAVKSLFQAMYTRKELEKWTVPSHIIASIRKFQLPISQVTQEDTNDIQSLIRSLTGEQPSSSRSPALGVKSMVKNGTIAEHPAHLPERPAAAPPPVSKSDVPRALSRLATRQLPAQDNTVRPGRVFGGLSSPKRPSSSLEDNLQPKRARIDASGRHGLTPSLLSRIGDAGSSDNSERIGRRRGKRTSKEQSPEPDKGVGYSIKGAATSQRTGSSADSTPRHSSLLDRIRADEGGGRKR